MTRNPIVLALLAVLLVGRATGAEQVTTSASEGFGPLRVTTEVAGSVKDRRGAVLSGVTITLEPMEAGGARQDAVSDAFGRYRFVVPVGRYRLTAQLQGSQVITREITPYLGGAQRFDIAFSVSGFGELTPPPPLPEPVPVRWNAWLARSGQPFVPQAPARSGQEYKLSVHLAGFDYATKLGVASRGASTALGVQLAKWLAEHPDDTEAQLKILLVPDARAIRVLDPAAADLSVSLKALRAFIAAPPAAPADPLTALASDPNQPFAFGRMQFNVAIVDGFTGTATVALSIWDGMRPIDELVLSFCVAQDGNALCNQRPGVAQSLYGIDAVRVAAGTADAEPDLALHFIDLPGRQVIGALRSKTWPAATFETWSLGLTAAEYRQRVQELARGLNAHTDDDHRRVGKALYDLLFPLPGASRVREVFEKSLLAFPAPSGFSEKPASLFVRSLVGGALDTPYLPAAFLYSPTMNAFVGSRASIEVPLPLQTYDRSQACIDRWVFFVPEGDDAALNTARTEVIGSLPAWKAAGAQMYGGRAEFAKWIESDEAETTPATLAILSHQEHDRLRFGDEYVMAESFIRRMADSIALLIACETTPPTHTALLRNLNTRGVAAIVGTTSKVNDRVGGAMLRELAAAASSKQRPDPVPLGVMLRRAQARLWQDATKNGHAPSELLKFMVIGNAGLAICTPTAPQ
jgi:hypothetical protein